MNGSLYTSLMLQTDYLNNISARCGSHLYLLVNPVG